jgi:hypothetical protein
MVTTFRVQLPGGLWHDATRHADAHVRGLIGADEEALLDQDADVAFDSAARRVTDLLARCVTVDGVPMAGSEDPSAIDIARSLSVGDREAILWHIRAATFGPMLDAIVECGSCGEKLDVTLEIDDLLQPPYPDAADRHAEVIGGAEVHFALPTGHDVEAVAPTALSDPVAAGNELLLRCLDEVDGRPAVAADVEAIGAALEARLAELDPQAEALFDIACPHCDASTTAVLDAAEYLFEDIARRSRYLYEEVHSLAVHYHWSEAEILALPTAKRRRYLDLIEATMRQRESL